MSKQDLMHQLSNAMRFSQNLADRFDETVSKRLGVSLTELRCFDIVTQHAGITAGDLAKAAGISPAAVTGVVDRLVERGWLTREMDARDRRRTLLRPTDKASAEVFPLYAPLYEFAMAQMSKHTVAELERQLAFYDEANAFVERIIEETEAGG